MSIHTEVTVRCDYWGCAEVSPAYPDVRGARTWTLSHRWSHDPPRDFCPVHSGDLPPEYQMPAPVRPGIEDLCDEQMRQARAEAHISRILSR